MYSPEKNAPKTAISNKKELEISKKQLSRIEYEANLLRKDKMYVIQCYPFLLEEGVTAANTKIQDPPSTTPPLQEESIIEEEDDDFWHGIYF